jgi:hypothetical protein
MIWFYRVSHPIMSDPGLVVKYTTHVPPYEEVIVQQQWTIQVPDPLQIIVNIRVELALEYSEVHPVFTRCVVGHLVGVSHSLGGVGSQEED